MNLIRVFVFLAFIPLLSTSCSGDDVQGRSEANRATPIAGYELSPMDLSRHITVSAQIEPIVVNRVASRMSGLITDLLVEEGDRVSAGQVLARLDVEEEKAEKNRAAAQLEHARTRYERIRELRERNAESAAAYEEVRTELKVAESEASLWETRVHLGEVRSGKDAVVTGKYVEAGDAVSANERLFQLSDISTLVARVGVAERDVVQLSSGDSVTVRIDAHGNRTFDGSIRRIFPSAEEASRLVTVEIELLQPENRPVIRPGYLARILMTTDHRPDVLAVPSESLLASGRDETFVYIIDEEDRLARRDVETGISRRNWTEILDGLQAGDVIVGANPTNLQEGMLVRVTRRIGEDLVEMANSGN